MRNVRRTLWVVLFLAIPCVAGTIIVNPDGTGDYPTIRSALDATNDGDEVLVNNGTYVENIVWPQRNNIKMTSVNGPDVTIN